MVMELLDQLEPPFELGGKVGMSQDELGRVRAFPGQETFQKPLDELPNSVLLIRPKNTVVPRVGNAH